MQNTQLGPWTASGQFADKGRSVKPQCSSEAEQLDVEAVEATLTEAQQQLQAGSVERPAGIGRRSLTAGSLLPGSLQGASDMQVQPLSSLVHASGSLQRGHSAGHAAAHVPGCGRNSHEHCICHH